jgi:hypothetical protein
MDDMLNQLLFSDDKEDKNERWMIWKHLEISMKKKNLVISKSS